MERDTIIKEKILYVGLVNFKSTYEFAHEWFKDEGFSITEDDYVEKVSGDAKDLMIRWTITKNITDYFKISINLEWKVLAMKDVEVEIDGKKKKMNKVAELSLKLKGTLDKDYTNSWSNKPMHAFFKDVYQKYVIPFRTNQKNQEVEEIVKQFKEEIKAFLDLTAKRSIG